MIQKYILTLDPGKSLSLDIIGGYKRVLPIGHYKVNQVGDNIQLICITRSNEEFSTHYSNLLSAPDTQMFNSAEEALEWFKENFFKDAPGSGGDMSDESVLADVMKSSTLSDWGDSFAAQIYNYLDAAFGREKIPYNGGVGGETSTQIKARFDVASGTRLSATNIFFVGRNNYNDVSTVLSDIAGMVNQLGHNRFAVISVFNGDYHSSESIGGAGYNNIMSINNALQQQYGKNYIDVRKVIVNAYNPELPDDVIAFSRDVPPPSLRADQLHLNATGYTLAANYIASHVRRYIDYSHAYVTFEALEKLLADPKQIGRNQTGAFRVGKDRGFEIQPGDVRFILTGTAPASATATGTLGAWRVAGGYLYVCTATNTWVRTALATW
ncbi:MAG: hypothetical protein KF862_07135 [Chitinophagaceae bacterium]|nr:hypothetical protein [Chitinophagaceae bacterium]